MIRIDNINNGYKVVSLIYNSMKRKKTNEYIKDIQRVTFN